MKSIFLSLFIFSFLLPPFQKVNPDAIVGFYWSPNKDVKLSFYKRNGKYYGKSVESKTPNLKDIYNPNPKLRDKAVLGQEVFYNFTYEDGEYINGKIYNPEDGNTYSAKMWIENGNLMVRGYIGLSIFGITKTMKKAKPEEHIN